MYFRGFTKRLFLLGHSCITGAKAFEIVCTPKPVLETALSALNNLRGDSLKDIKNESYRFAGYKQYTWWIHNRLGKGIRKVIPSCAIWAIRDKYPAENNLYTPFMESQEEENRAVSCK